MTLLRFDGIGLEFGDQLILNDAEFSIDSGERICLIGRNGAGKSTTLKLIMGTIEADRGKIVKRSDLIVSQLQQNLPEAMDRSVTDVIRSGLTGIESLLTNTRSAHGRSLTNRACANSKRCTRRSMHTTAGTSNSASRRRSRN